MRKDKMKKRKREEMCMRVFVQKETHKHKNGEKEQTEK